MEINLTKPGPYEVIRFPDGQQSIKLKVDPGEHVMVRSRLSNWSDVELLLCTSAALRRLGCTASYYLPYIIGGRSDRLLEIGSVNYVKDVISPVINSLKACNIFTIDPHSDVTEACIDNLYINTNHEFFLWVLNKLKKDVEVIAPDAGSAKKAFKLPFNGGITVCTKSRDIQGNLTHVTVPISDPTKTFLIVDDICDGGATFINIADKILEQNPEAELYLAVTHGIFSKGLAELNKRFKGIFSTNSYKETEVTQFNVL